MFWLFPFSMKLFWLYWFISRTKRVIFDYFSWYYLERQLGRATQKLDYLSFRKPEVWVEPELKIRPGWKLGPNLSLYSYENSAWAWAYSQSEIGLKPELNICYLLFFVIASPFMALFLVPISILCIRL